MSGQGGAWSPWEGASRAPLRWAAALANLSCLRLMVELAGAHRGDPGLDGAAAWLVEGVRSPPILALLGVAGLVLLAGFAAGVRAAWAGLGAFLVLLVLQYALNKLDRDPMEPFYLPGAALLAWSVGLLVARRAFGEDGGPRADAVAEAMVVGAIAGAYTLAGLSKVAQSGLAWADGHSLRAFLLSLGRLDPESWRGRLHGWLVATPAAAHAAAGGVLAFQLSCVTYLTGRRARAVWGTFFIAFHLGTLALMRISYLENAFILAAFSYPWPALWQREGSSETQLPAGPARPGLARGSIAGAAALAGAAWLLPVAWTAPSSPQGRVAPALDATRLPAGWHATSRPDGDAWCFSFWKEGARVGVRVPAGEARAEGGCGPGGREAVVVEAAGMSALSRHDDAAVGALPELLGAIMP